MSRSRPSPLLSALLALAVIALLGIVILLAPLGMREARREWFFYKNRNNPSCGWVRDCFSFALKSCPPPDFITECVRKDWTQKQGVCVCGEDFVGGVPVRVQMEYEQKERDAGADASY